MEVVLVDFESFGGVDARVDRRWYDESGYEGVV